MNLTNPVSEYEHERNSSSDDENDEPKKRCDKIPSIRIEQFFSDDDNDDNELDTSDDDDDDDNDQSDIENHSFIKSQLPPPTRLCSLLRQSNRLVELKLNLLQNRSINTNITTQQYHHHHHQQQQQQQLSIRHALSESDMSKRSHHYQTNQQVHEHQQSILLPSFSSNQFYLSTNQSHRLYLPSSLLYDLQIHINQWLQESTCLIDSISTLTYHRQCWSQLLLTYLIEQGYIHLEFLRCTNSSSVTTIDHSSCSTEHRHGCVPEEDAYKLCSILQKGSRFNIDSIIFDHIRRIIVIKSIQEVGHDNTNLQQIYLKQLKSLKQSLIHQRSSVMNINNSNPIRSIASIYSKLLLFLSSLYSIKAETMQILFCQHLLHNPAYSYLMAS